MTCWRCKREMPDGLKYCGHCGVRMNRTLYLLEWLFSGKGLPVLIGVLVVAVVVTAVLLWPAKNTDMLNVLQGSLDVALMIPEEPVDGASEITPAEEPDFLAEIELRNGYEVLSCEETEQGLTAVLNVYAPDVYNLAKELDAQGSAVNPDAMQAVLVEAVQNAPIVKNEVQLLFVLTDNGYKPILTGEFMDAYYGGVIRLLEEMVNQRINGTEVGQ